MHVDRFSPPRSPNEEYVENGERVRLWHFGARTVSVSEHPDGLVTEAWWLGDAFRALHRVGAPAMLDFRNGALSEVQFAVEGMRHRLGGPDYLYFADGVPVRTEYAYEGRSFELVEEWAYFLGTVDPQELRSSLRRSGFEAVLDGGASVAEMLEVFGRGVLTPGGVAQVLAGAPVDWVRSFESGAVTAPE